MYRDRRARRCDHVPTNAYCGVIQLEPVDPTAAEAVEQAWAPVLGGQLIPKLGERRDDVEEERECD